MHHAGKIAPYPEHESVVEEYLVADDQGRMVKQLLSEGVKKENMLSWTKT
ncbi:hypothetical protein NUBL22010_43640 [Klebsiella pneumoniae]|nr:hypothetical protein NUBL22010_43640 [Klebsiella pneumoniae]